MLQTLVSNNPNVVFIGTTGNARRDFDTTHAAKTKPNLLLIGGCLKDGGFHNGRGFGANTVDLFVPSDNIPVYDPADASHDLTAAKKALQDADIAEAILLANVRALLPAAAAAAACAHTRAPT